MNNDMTPPPFFPINAYKTEEDRIGALAGDLLRHDPNMSNEEIAKHVGARIGRDLTAEEVSEIVD